MVKKFLLFLVVIMLIGSGYLWLNREAWLADFNAERAQQRDEYRQSGELFGSSNTQQTCLAHTLASFDGCTGFHCTVNHGVFLKACLAKAAPSGDFCHEVPTYRDEPTEEDKTWAKHTCWDQNIRGEGCRLLLRQQQLFCSLQK